jgi:iron complex transport system substrate-binding protein
VRRIIAIAPDLAELVYAAGAGQWLIATVRGADFPPQVTELPSVGDAAGLDFERIRRLEPDLILAWGSGNKPADLSRLEAGPVATVVLEPHTLGDVARHLRIIGKMAGTQPAAETAASRFEQGLRRLRQRYADADVINVVVEIWQQPLFTVGPAHPLSDALRTCGARNALTNYPLLAGPVPIEDVLAAHADAIVSVTGMPEPDMRAHWSRFLSLPGGRSVRLISIDPDLLTRSGPRILEGVELLCARLDQLRGKSAD